MSDNAVDKGADKSVTNETTSEQDWCDGFDPFVLLIVLVLVVKIDVKVDVAEAHSEQLRDITMLREHAEFEAAEANRRARRNGWIAWILGLLLVISAGLGVYFAQDDTGNTAPTQIRISEGASVEITTNGNPVEISILPGNPAEEGLQGSANGRELDSLATNGTTWPEAECLAWWYGADQDGNVRITHLPLNERGGVCTQS